MAEAKNHRAVTDNQGHDGAPRVWCFDCLAMLDGTEPANCEPVEPCGMAFGDGYTCDLPRGHE